VLAKEWTQITLFVAGSQPAIIVNRLSFYPVLMQIYLTTLERKEKARRMTGGLSLLLALCLN
jgi:hypothetical protein